MPWQSIYKIQHAVPLRAGLPTKYAAPLRAGLPTQYAVLLRVGLAKEHAAPLRAGLPIQYITMQYDMVRNAKRNTTLHYSKRLEYTIIYIQLRQSY